MPPDMRRSASGLPISEARVYRPTMEEFKDFRKFVEKIEAEGAGEAGICKVIPPKEWIPRKAGYNLEDMNFLINRPILQKFNLFGDITGAYQTKAVVKNKMTLSEYYDLCHEPNYLAPHFESHEEAERKYWKTIMFSAPIYGCDVAEPLSDPDLNVWNISKLGCILDMIKEDKNTSIQGVLSPYLYFGMWKATFSWHIEDLDLFAINMVHHGAPKTWYCVPPKYGHLLERAARRMFPTVASWCSNFMRHKTCLISPQALDKFGVPYQKIVQQEREIIITFPYAYHQGFNHGFNIAESTNFAMPSWIEYGKRSKPCDCEMVRVQFPMDLFIKEFQPEKYQDWVNKRDIAPHPMDPPDVVKRVKLQSENPKAYAKLVASSFSGKKRPRSKTETVTSTDRKFILYDVYRHHELSNVLVQYNSESGRIRKGAVRLASFIDNPNIPQLVAQGHLIKVDVVKVFKDHRNNSQRAAKRKKLSDLNDTQSTISDVKSNPRSKSLHTKERNGENFYQKFKTEEVTLVKLLHKETGIKIKVFPETYKPAFNVPRELSKIVDLKDVKALIEAQIFSVEGETAVQMKKLTSRPAFAPPFINCNLFFTLGSNLPVKVVCDSEIVLDSHFPHIMELLDEKPLKELIDESRLLFFTKMRLRRRDPSEKLPDDILHDGYNPEDLIANSDLTSEFVMEDDPEFRSLTNTHKRKKSKKSISRKNSINKKELQKRRKVPKGKTKDIVRSFKSKVRDENDRLLLTLNDLINSTKSSSKTVLSIIEVLEELKLVDVINPLASDDDLKYVWNGLDQNGLKSMIDQIVQTNQDQNTVTSCNYKSVARAIISKVMLENQGDIVNLESQNTDPTKVSPFNKRLPLTIGVLEALGIFKSVPGRKNVVFCPSGENLNRAKGIRDARIRKALPNQNETKELVQKTKELLTILLSKFPRTDGLHRISVEEVVAETTLHPNNVNRIFLILENLKVVKRVPDSTTQLVWRGYKRIRLERALTNWIEKPRFLQKSMTISAIRLLASLKLLDSGVDLSQLNFPKRTQPKFYSHIFLVVGVLHALDLVCFDPETYSLKWTLYDQSDLQKNVQDDSPKTPIAKGEKDALFNQSDLQKNVQDCSPKTSIAKRVKGPSSNQSDENFSLVDISKKTNEILDYLKTNIGSSRKCEFSIRKLNEFRISSTLPFSDIFQILFRLRVITKVQNGNYYLRNYDNAFLKNHLQNFTKVQWKSSLEETLCTTCQQLSRGEYEFLNLENPTREMKIILGVLVTLGIISHTCDDGNFKVSYLL